MSKYLCWCGKEYRTLKEAQKHVQTSEPLGGEYVHSVSKLHWRSRILKFILDNHVFYLRLSGALMLFGVIVSHFNIDLSLIESFIIGLGIGCFILKT